MAGPATLKIEIIADATHAISGLGKLETAAGRAGSNAETAGGKFKTFAKHAAMLAGTAAWSGLVSMFKIGFQEQSDFLPAGAVGEQVAVDRQRGAHQRHTWRIWSGRCRTTLGSRTTRSCPRRSCC